MLNILIVIWTLRIEGTEGNTVLFRNHLVPEESRELKTDVVVWVEKFSTGASKEARGIQF